MISVVLCAAGGGVRAGFDGNKILQEYCGLPVISYSLSAFAPFGDEILIACREEDRKNLLPLLSPYPAARLVAGGKTRTESVFYALKETKGDLVLVHDAARPFVTAKLIQDCIDCAAQYGSGVCALPATDTAALCEEEEIVSSLPREKLYTLQTPQGFGREALLLAYERAFSEGRADEFTDESGIYGAYIGRPHLFEGDRRNRKLTFREDFAPVERVGFGVDTHAFAHAGEFERGIARLNLNYIKLGGATVPSDRALAAHSDGDVAVHALMDALLSAASLRDIGYYFPEYDEKYRGADSMELLKRVMDFIGERGFKVKNVCITILAERPRLSPYIETMRKRLSAALSCDNVAIAAGTNEKLGYVGEGKGITAYAAAYLAEKHMGEKRE